ncbi:pectate lyase [Pseudoduganella sp. RAF53_2]|uniref:pectate lyase n=1 Tax=unclassified Pseudoduganella TaxID=2637179 RepID=UPI003F9D567D
MKRAALVLLAAPMAAHAAVLGHMTPAEPLTDARIASLPAAEQGAWRAYLAKSQAQLDVDQAALAAERIVGPVPSAPPSGKAGGGMPLNRPAAWYGSPEARHVADNIISFQTPAGGWGKNVDRSGPVRVRGQHYISFEGAKESWNFVGTIDNDATSTELRFLARVQAQAPGAAGETYRAAFVKSVRYLLNSQYPNGGFPQVYPLQGGYHDAITINDDAFSNVLQVLLDAAARQGDDAFVTPELAGEARAAADKAIRVILASQIVVNGVRTGWCQQHDELTLVPAGARNFEPVALSSFETARMLDVLMRLNDPSPDIAAAVRAGAAWLERVAVPDVEWTAASPDAGRRLVVKAGAGPLWSRYYDISTMKPIFGDRDRSIHDDVNELSLERRNGYGWWGNGPAKTLQAFAAWSGKHH